MNLPRTAVVAALTLLCCGPRAPGPHPDETMFWRITSSEAAMTACTDDPSFKDQVKPIEYTDNTYLMYRVAKDGKQATALACTQLDSRTCQDSPSGIVFDVAEHELLYATESKEAIGDGGCQLQGAQSWVLTDKGETLTMEVNNSLSLVDSPTVCPKIEEQVKAQSPNGLGVQGCIVQYTIGATIK